MASASSAAAIGGATEHTGCCFEGVLAFSNLGLAGKAFTGQKWPRHEGRLIALVQALFHQATERGRGLLGVLLNEVGNLSELVDENGRQNMDRMLETSFQRSCGGVPNILWSEGETMAAFRPSVEVARLDTLDFLVRDAPWRSVERFVLTGAAEHGRCNLLVYNQHQPCSSERPFPQPQKLEFCKAIIEDAVRYCADDDESVGFVFGGDANVGLAAWNAALRENTAWKVTFEQPDFLYGRRHKGRDLMIAAGRKGAGLQVFANNCRVEGREEQHDPMFFEFSCTGHRPERRVLPETGRVRRTRPRFEGGGAPKHAGNAAQRERADQERDDTAQEHGRADDETEEHQTKQRSRKTKNNKLFLLRCCEARPGGGTQRCFRARCKWCP